MIYYASTIRWARVRHTPNSGLAYVLCRYAAKLRIAAALRSSNTGVDTMNSRTLTDKLAPLGLGLLGALAALLMNDNGDTLHLLACAGCVGALALLGPGAFSIDAKWYGRRVIRLVGRSPDGGGLN